MINFVPVFTVSASWDILAFKWGKVPGPLCSNLLPLVVCWLGFLSHPGYPGSIPRQETKLSLLNHSLFSPLGDHSQLQDKIIIIIFPQQKIPPFFYTSSHQQHVSPSLTHWSAPSSVLVTLITYYNFLTLKALTPPKVIELFIPILMVSRLMYIFHNCICRENQFGNFRRVSS